MFGLGRRKQETVSPAPVAQPVTGIARLYELTFFPDGETIGAGWADVPLGRFDKPGDGKIDGSFTVGDAQCRIDATLRYRNAILSMWADNKIVTSSLLLGSGDAAKDAELTAMYLASVRNSNLVQQLTQGRTVFGEVETCAERPLLATLLMPAPSRDLTDTLIAVQRDWAAAVIG